MEEKIKSIRLTATRLAKWERMLGFALTQLTDANLGFNAFVTMLQAAGLTDEEIDKASEEMGLEKFCEACQKALMDSGLFKQATEPQRPPRANQK